jgi:hypothetical protein
VGDSGSTTRRLAFREAVLGALQVKKKSTSWEAIRREVLRSWRPWMKARFPHNVSGLSSHALREQVSQAFNETNWAVCEAVHVFAMTGFWPLDASKYKYFLAKRLDFANQILLCVIHGPSIPPPQPSREAIFRWLLIECWELHGWRCSVNSLEADESRDAIIRRLRR